MELRQLKYFALLLPVGLGKILLNLLAQRQQIVLHHVPNHIGPDLKISVNNVVAHSLNLAPRRGWVLFFELF